MVGEGWVDEMVIEELVQEHRRKQIRRYSFHLQDGEPFCKVKLRIFILWSHW